MNGSATIFPRGSFALKLRKLPRATIDARVQEAAGLLSIGDLLARKPNQLSGGQRERVALGRAIVRHPQVFLFDEPLSNLQGGSVSFPRPPHEGPRKPGEKSGPAAPMPNDKSRAHGLR